MLLVWVFGQDFKDDIYENSDESGFNVADLACFNGV